MALSLLLQDSQNVKILETAFDHFRIANRLFQDKAQAIDHIPNQLWRLEHVEKGHELAPDKLKKLGVVDLGIDVLAMGNLFFFTLREPVIVSLQFKDVFRKLTRDRSCCALLVLIGSIDPKIDLFKHLMDAKRMLKHQYLLQCRHLQRCYPVSSGRIRCILDLGLA